MIAAAVATAVSAAACVALVIAEHAGRRGRGARLVWKPLASAAFIAVPIAGGALSGGLAAGRPATWIIAGLVLGAIGDVLLLFESRFLAGLVVFLCGHVAYVVGFSRAVPIDAWPGAAAVPALGAIACGALALVWLWPHAGSMRGPVVAYVAVIVTMVIGAAAVAAAAPWPPARARLVLAGAGLFFASDLAVARDRFVAPGFVNRLWGLPAYYAAQLVIGWSLIVA